MKPPGLAKQRLAGALAGERRAALARWMLERVVVAATACSRIGEVAVAGGDASVTALCSRLRVRWDPEPAPGLNPTLQAAKHATDEAGWDGMLFLPADLPRLSAADVAGVVEASAGGRLVLAPGRRIGTNAILVPRGVDFTFQLGPESFQRHSAQAARLGIRWRTFHAPAIEADVDLPEDLAELERAEPRLWRLVAEANRCYMPGVSFGL